MVAGRDVESRCTEINFFFLDERNYSIFSYGWDDNRREKKKN